MNDMRALEIVARNQVSVVRELLDRIDRLEFEAARRECANCARLESELVRLQSRYEEAAARAAARAEAARAAMPTTAPVSAQEAVDFKQQRLGQWVEAEAQLSARQRAEETP